jgi:hypothetical protein
MASRYVKSFDKRATRDYLTYFEYLNISLAYVEH